MYLDTAYLAKFYVNEPGSPQVRELVYRAGGARCSVWALAEFHAVVHRHVREGSLTRAEARRAAAQFSGHIEAGLWEMLPVTEALLRRTSALLLEAPREIYLRTADAVHLTTARDCGEQEVWTSDRHMLAAAPCFGLTGRSA